MSGWAVHTFDDACKLLIQHCKPGHTLEQTVNRLFLKHLRARPELAKNPPTLSHSNTLIVVETKTKQEFADLPLTSEGKAWESDALLVIVRYRGIDCLIDGSHRCRAWKTSGDVSAHTACVIVVRE